MSDDPTEQVLAQRIRNRMIEYWEWVASADAQRKYQEAVPYVSVSNEAINQWQDWQPYDNPEIHYSLPVFTEDETSMIVCFHRVWSEVADATPDPMPPLCELECNQDWKWLMNAADKAYGLFMRRGKLSENYNQTGADASNAASGDV